MAFFLSDILRPMTNVIAYIDGFNLFHAIDDLHDPEIKWVDLMALCQSIIGDDETLVAVKYFTAYAKWREAGYRRHQRYVKALEENGVQVVLGQFKRKRVRCQAECGQKFWTHEEKETDVNVGSHLVADALKSRFDRALIISADTDMGAGIEVAKREAPDKLIQVVAPPKRLSRARDLNPLFEITPGRIRKNLFSDEIKSIIVG